MIQLHGRSKQIKIINKNLVSVIIPNYNHAAYLGKRLDSVLQQTYAHFEVIILDDCSTDNSREIIEQYSNHKKVSNIYFNKTNSGNTFHQWKKGIDLAKGKYVWIAESDDYCDDNFLEVTVGLLDKNLNAGLAYCKSVMVNEESKYENDLSFWYDELSDTKWKSDFINSGQSEIREFLSIRNTIPNASAVLIRKANLPNEFKEILFYKLCGDWLHWIKVLEKSDIIFTTKTCNYFRVHSNTVRKQSKSKRVEKERFRIYKYLYNKKLIDKKEFKKLIPEIPSIGKILFNKAKRFLSFSA